MGASAMTDRRFEFSVVKLCNFMCLTTVLCLCNVTLLTPLRHPEGV